MIIASIASLGLEEILSKIYDVHSTYEIQQQISVYNEQRSVDARGYIEMHADLVSPQWADGKDLNGLANFLVTRWASTPNLQSVVCATFCELLQIPADDTQGMSKWLLINKVVTKVASGYKEILRLEDVDLKQVATSVFNLEVLLKQELEGAVGQINTLNARLLNFEKEAEALRKKKRRVNLASSKGKSRTRNHCNNS